MIMRLLKQVDGGGDGGGELYHEMNNFLQTLPHGYIEYDLAHEVILGEEKVFLRCVEKVEAFLPYIDNWLTCDGFKVKAFEKNREEVLGLCLKWIKSEEIYTVRFGVVNLMRYFLKDGYFFPGILDEVRDVAEKWSGDGEGGENNARGEGNFKREIIAGELEQKGYYVKMACAWFLAEALVRQWDDAVGLIEQKKLPWWIHNKTISKACDSRRIKKEDKEYLKSFRINK